MITETSRPRLLPARYARKVGVEESDESALQLLYIELEILTDS
jgi:hypothetical protein